MNTIVVHNFSLGYRRSLARPEAIFPTFSLSASSSEMIALIGRNGVGKSTFLRTLVGLQKPLSGELQIMDKRIDSYSQRQLASLVSFVSTEAVRVHNLKVFNLVALGRFPHTDWLGSLSNDDKAHVLEALDMVGIRHLIWRDVSELSDGELQRAMIARTLAQDTPIIILDEPTAFLDLPNRYEILLLLRRLARQKGKTIIFSTHDLGIAMRLVDKIWLMTANGMRQGAPEDLALCNAYDELFEGTLLSFNHQQGGVDLGIEPTSEIYLKTSANDYWIKRALERMGFKPINTPQTDIPTLEVLYNNHSFEFILTTHNQQQTFTNLYSLGRWWL